MRSFGEWFADQGKPQGIDPEDEATWPEGLSYSLMRKQWEYKCESCGQESEWYVEPELFELGNYANVCGRDPRCCP